MNIVDENGFDQKGRPCKELYLMNMCFQAAKKSMDPATKCGCVITDRYGGILTTGYNGPPMGCDDDRIPLTRPDKYMVVVHSEVNAIYTAARRGTMIEGATFYVTGLPCLNCMMAILQCRADAVVFGPLMANMLKDEDYLRFYPIILYGQSLQIQKFRYNEGLKQLSQDPDIAEIVDSAEPFDADWIWK